jgi:hypothetical protein
MTVKVCDALCGAGKTVSCINMMNRDTSKRYVFITPYLNEVERIKACCGRRRFLSPEPKKTNDYSKLQDMHELLKSKENIVSTHALFSCYTDETKELIRTGEYTLILDEVLDLFQPVDLDKGDIQMLLRRNVAHKRNNDVIWGDDEYNGVLFADIVRMSKSKNIIDYGGSFFFWTIPFDVFECFADAYVLTYLFEYQILRYFFDIHGIGYRLIGTKKEEDTYQFCELWEMNRCVDLSDKITIIENNKVNKVGNGLFSLSANWFKKCSEEENQKDILALKNNLYNVFRNGFGGKNSERMWTTLNKYKTRLRGKGYSNSFVVYNKRATNDLMDKKYLAYCVNVFLQPWIKSYLSNIGDVEVDQDMYALSVLIQWIFRSAIRKGEKIWIYVPSRRMRFLLEQWILNLCKGEDLKPIKFVGKKTSNQGSLRLLKSRKKEEGGNMVER